MLFELLTGSPPFGTRDDEVAKMYAHLEEEPPSLRALRPDQPGGLDQPIRRALGKDPAERYPSAGDFARAVSAAVEGGATVAAERSVATGAAAPLAPAAEIAEAPPRIETATTPAAATTAPRPTVHAPIRKLEGIEASEPEVTRAPPPVPPKRKRRGIALAALGAVALGAAVVAVLLVAGGGDESAPDKEGIGRAAHGSGERGSETTKAKVVGKPIPVGDLPVGIAHAEGGVWTANRLGGSVSFVDTVELASRPFDTGPGTEGVAAGGGSIWVANGDAGAVSQVDPARPFRSTPIAVGGSPGGLALGARSAWVADSGGNSVTRLAPADPSQQQSIRVGREPYGVAVGLKSVWVTTEECDANRADDGILAEHPSRRRDEGEAAGQVEERLAT